MEERNHTPDRDHCQGFGGTILARRLGRQLPEGWEVLLPSEESYTIRNPMLPGYAGRAGRR